jgi:hypothetical protein
MNHMTWETHHMNCEKYNPARMSSKQKMKTYHDCILETHIHRSFYHLVKDGDVFKL